VPWRSWFEKEYSRSIIADAGKTAAERKKKGKGKLVGQKIGDGNPWVGDRSGDGGVC